MRAKVPFDPQALDMRIVILAILLLVGCMGSEKQKEMDLLSSYWVKTQGCVFAMRKHFGNTAVFQFLPGESEPNCPLLKKGEKNAKKEGGRTLDFF